LKKGKAGEYKRYSSTFMTDLRCVEFRNYRKMVVAINRTRLKSYENVLPEKSFCQLLHKVNGNAILQALFSWAHTPI